MPRLPVAFIHLQALLRSALLRPDIRVPSIANIDFRKLRKEGYNAVVIDKDNCLTWPERDALYPGLENAWRNLKSAFEPGRVLVVSNSAGTKKDPSGIAAESTSLSLKAPVLIHSRPKPGCAEEIIQYFKGALGAPTLPRDAFAIMEKQKAREVEEDERALISRFKDQIEGPLLGPFVQSATPGAEGGKEDAEEAALGSARDKLKEDIKVSQEGFGSASAEETATRGMDRDSEGLKMIVIGDRLFTDVLLARQLENFLPPPTSNPTSHVVASHRQLPASSSPSPSSSPPSSPNPTPATPISPVASASPPSTSIPSSSSSPTSAPASLSTPSSSSSASPSSSIPPTPTRPQNTPPTRPAPAPLPRVLSIQTTFLPSPDQRLLRFIESSYSGYLLRPPPSSNYWTRMGIERPSSSSSSSSVSFTSSSPAASASSSGKSSKGLRSFLRLPTLSIPSFFRRNSNPSPRTISSSPTYNSSSILTSSSSLSSPSPSPPASLPLRLTRGTYTTLLFLSSALVWTLRKTWSGVEWSTAKLLNMAQGCKVLKSKYRGTIEGVKEGVEVLKRASGSS